MNREQTLAPQGHNSLHPQVLGVVGWTSRHRFRAARFEMFWYLHNVAIEAWLAV